VLMVSSPDQKRDRDFTWMDWAYGERFSADGKQILFGDQHSGSLYGVFLRNMDGSPAVRLGDGNPQDLSADGKWALSDLPSDPKQLLLLPTGAGEPRQLTHSKISHSAARFLVDGRVVANGNESGHAERAYLVDLNGNETAITPEGILAAGISNDGKRLLVRTGPDTFQIEPIAGGPSQPVPQLQKGDYPTNFTADDTALIVVRYPAQLTGEIWRVELSGNKRTLLHTIVVSEAPSVSTSLGLSASRDGKNYAYVFGRRMSTEYLVEGLH
jgi:eukaryotic-like serine/threonine-protein kinase